jgi:hypothetical protein
LFFLIPAFKSRLLAFEGHSSTNRYSPGGAFTLMQPVDKAKSFFKCASRAAFHYSRSPLYLLVYISLVVSLWIYNQHDRSGSNVTFFDRVFVGCHFSVFFFAVDGCVVAGVCAGCFYFYGYVCVGGF